MIEKLVNHRITSYSCSVVICVKTEVFLHLVVHVLLLTQSIDGRDRIIDNIEIIDLFLKYLVVVTHCLFCMQIVTFQQMRHSLHPVTIASIENKTELRKSSKCILSIHLSLLLLAIVIILFLEIRVQDEVGCVTKCITAQIFFCVTEYVSSFSDIFFCYHNHMLVMHPLSDTYSCDCEDYFGDSTEVTCRVYFSTLSEIIIVSLHFLCQIPHAKIWHKSISLSHSELSVSVFHTRVLKNGFFN